MPRSIGLTLIEGVFALCVAHGQVAIQPRSGPLSQTAPSHRNLRVDSNLVLVPVSVCDPMNRPVTGLEKEHFRLYDDHIEQTVTQFAMEDEPVAVGLVFDISGSMGPKLRLARDAVAQFLDTANPEDEFFLVEFNDRPTLVVPLTRDTEGIQNQLAFAQSRGRTALLDALALSLHELKRSTERRKALLIISDGGDNASRYTEGELRHMVREGDALIYAIGIYEPFASRGRSPEEAAGPGLLGDLASQTGGTHFPAELAELPDIAAKIGLAMRNRYVLGYSPTDRQRDGRYHRVEIKVVPPRGLPKLNAHWRLGYFAPYE